MIVPVPTKNVIAVEWPKNQQYPGRTSLWAASEDSELNAHENFDWIFDVVAEIDH